MLGWSLWVTPAPPQTNILPSCMHTQSILTSSLLAPSQNCFGPPNTCVLQEVNTHQQSTQKLPLCSINSSLYCVRPGSVWTAKVRRLLLQSTSERWQMAVGGHCNSNTCHLWLEWRTNKTLCVQPQITYLNTWWNGESDLLELGFRYYVSEYRITVLCALMGVSLTRAHTKLDQVEWMDKWKKKRDNKQNI